MYSVNFADRTTSSSVARNFATLFLMASDFTIVIWILIVLLSTNFNWRSQPALIALAAVGSLWFVGLLMMFVQSRKLSVRQRRNAIINIVLTATLIGFTLGGAIILQRLDSQSLDQEQIICNDKANESGVLLSECQ